MTANGFAGSYSVTVAVAGANGAAFSLTNTTATTGGPSTVTVPPTVVGFQVVGITDHRTELVLTFSEPLDAARAQDPANYRLVWAGSIIGSRPGTIRSSGPPPSTMPPRSR